MSAQWYTDYVAWLKEIAAADAQVPDLGPHLSAAGSELAYAHGQAYARLQSNAHRTLKAIEIEREANRYRDSAARLVVELKQTLKDADGAFLEQPSEKVRDG